MKHQQSPSSSIQSLISHLYLLFPLALYAPTFTLPFFWDDVANFQHLFGKPISQVWLDSRGFPYYRPLTFTIWYAMQNIFGATNTVAFHALNVIALLLLAWAVRQLAYKLTNNTLIAFIAGLFMGLFPFAALVVPLVASLFHLLVTLGAVLGCLALLEYESTQHLRWAIIAIILSCITPFIHESGATASALMAVCLGATLLTRHPKNLFATSTIKSSAVVIIAFIFNIIAFFIWRSVPKDQGAFQWVGFDSIAQSSVFFLEGFTFPAQFPARWLINQFALPELTAALIMGIVGLIVLWFMLRNWKWFLFGLAYCYLAAAPAIVALHFSYITVSPRLMVYTAPAAAIVWAVAVVAAAQQLRAISWQNAFAAVLVGAFIITPIRHIQYEVELHHLALDHLWDFVNALKSDPQSKHLVVNPVNWIAKPQLTYAIGHEGVEVTPGYLNPQLMAWIHTQKLYNVEGVTFELVSKRLENLFYAPWGEHVDWEAMAVATRKADRVWYVAYSENKIELLELGRVIPARGEALINFADRIWLTGVQSAAKADHLELRLQWRVNAKSGEDIFAHALDCEGHVLGQFDGASLGGVYPIWLWQAGETIEEIRRVPTNGGQVCSVELGLFDPKTGKRTPAQEANGQALANDVFLIVMK